MAKREGVWEGSWPLERPWIPIPGARDLTARECAAGRTRQQTQLGARYVLIDRGLAERLQPFGRWCSERAELSIVDPDAIWLPHSVWISDRDAPLLLPFMPEYDEPGEDLRRVASGERRYREAAAHLEEARQIRSRAFANAAGRRSRRRIAEAAGLSFARVQQLVASRSE
jgi:hypothetical protein